MREQALPLPVTLIQITLPASAAAEIAGGTEAFEKQKEERDWAGGKSKPWDIRCWDASDSADSSSTGKFSPGEPTGLNDFEKSLLKPPRTSGGGSRRLQVWFFAGTNQMKHPDYKHIEDIKKELKKHAERVEFDTISYDDASKNMPSPDRLAALVHVRGTVVDTDVEPHRLIVTNSVRNSLPLVCERQDLLFAVAQLSKPAEMPELELNRGGLENFNLAKQKRALLAAILRKIR